MRRRLALAGLVVTSSLFAVGFAELGLRIAGFSFDMLPTVQFGWPEPELMVRAYLPDRELLWVRRDYEETLEQARQEPAVVFMGDSCTEFSNYPEIALRRLDEMGLDVATGVNLGTGGWTTEQGLR